MPGTVLAFWFQEIQPAQWWKVDPSFDALVRTRFGALHEQAKRCELFAWRATPEGRLAEVIVLDQFARNIHRGTPRAFAGDPLALALAQEAVAAGADLALPVDQRAFLYLPWMHSESAAIHAVGEPLMRALLTQSYRLRSFSRTQSTLEDVFLAATRRSWDVRSDDLRRH